MHKEPINVVLRITRRHQRCGGATLPPSSLNSHKRCTPEASASAPANATHSAATSTTDGLYVTWVWGSCWPRFLRTHRENRGKKHRCAAPLSPPTHVAGVGRARKKHSTFSVLFGPAARRMGCDVHSLTEPARTCGLAVAATLMPRQLLPLPRCHCCCCHHCREHTQKSPPAAGPFH